jgi:hypothetical protein
VLAIAERGLTQCGKPRMISHATIQSPARLPTRVATHICWSVRCSRGLPCSTSRSSDCSSSSSRTCSGRPSGSLPGSGLSVVSLLAAASLEPSPGPLCCVLT